MLQFMGAVCIVCMLSLFSNTHGLTWIVLHQTTTHHSHIGPRYRGASWGIAQSQVIHHQTGPKYDPAVRRQLCRDNDYVGKSLKCNTSEYNKQWVALFFTYKKKDWIIPKKQKNKNARHNGPSTSGCLPHDFFKDLWLSIGSHGPSIVNLVTTTESRGVEYDSSTVHQFTNQHRKKHRCHFELPVASTKLDLTSRFLTNISCPCYKFTNPEMWNVSQSSFKHWSERTTKNDRPWGGASLCANVYCTC